MDQVLKHFHLREMGSERPHHQGYHLKEQLNGPNSSQIPFLSSFLGPTDQRIIIKSTNN
jgi:hypothetical protein